MSLALDSLVTDLIFESGDGLDPEVLVEALGGKDELAAQQVIDPDMQDPRFEMELSPSMPFRRRGERRLMIADSRVAPMRQDPQTETLVPLDLRPAKARLIDICKAVPVRLGRLFALGSWGDAVWVAHNYRDLRGICLLGWVLDPMTDLSGRRRANPLGQNEFEEKLMSYDKRLDELDDDAIRECLQGANVVEEDGLIIVDVLEADGTWDLQRSLDLETELAAIERFSTFVGAKSIAGKSDKSKEAGSKEAASQAAKAPPAASAAKETPAAAPANLPALRATKLGEGLLIIFPAERFDLEIAAALGKKDWDSILVPSDPINGAQKDLLYGTGAEFIAPVEFLSECFVQGKPLNKAQFEESATATKDGTKTMEVHFPRFGPVTLFARPDGSRFVCSHLGDSQHVLDAL